MYLGDQRRVLTRSMLPFVYHWFRFSIFSTSFFDAIPVQPVHPCLLDTVYLRLTWTLYFWLTLLPPQGLTSPKPERGCVKTDCFDEALCREYEQHHVMTSSTINHKHHLRLMMMMWFIGRWWKVMEGRKGIEQWWDGGFFYVWYFSLTLDIVNMKTFAIERISMFLLLACVAPSCTATSLSASPITMTTTSLVKPGNDLEDQLINDIVFPIASDAKRVISPSGVPPMTPVCVTAALVTHNDDWLPQIYYFRCCCSCRLGFLPLSTQKFLSPKLYILYSKGVW